MLVSPILANCKSVRYTADGNNVLSTRLDLSSNSLLDTYGSRAVASFVIDGGVLDVSKVLNPSDFQS